MPLKDADAPDADEENRGVFKRADRYKMHAYRDALPTVRSAWVLYPGSDLRFFGTSGAVADCVDQPQPRPVGVGAAPLSPGLEGDDVARRPQDRRLSRPALLGTLGTLAEVFGESIEGWLDR